MSKKQIGAIEWQDLTVSDAKELQQFYADVVGWKVSPVSMGDYEDYNMQTDGGTTVAGICHARGSNAGLPAQWLLYVRVESVTKAVESCIKLGGRLIEGPRSMGKELFCFIEDPAGAVMALVSQAEAPRSRGA